MRGAFRFLRIRSGAIGLAVVLLVIAVAFLGRYVAPHDPNSPVGAPLAGPSSAAHLGTDFLGRDVQSRLLYGGRSVIGLAAAATTLAYAIGLAIGLVAGYTRSNIDPLLMRTVDVMLAFPPAASGPPRLSSARCCPTSSRPCWSTPACASRIRS